MRRRHFITLLGGATAWPLAAHAQQPAVPVVGFLNLTSEAANAPFAAAFQRGLSEIGYVVGRNVAIAYRFAEGRSERLPALAEDLVHRQVTVIATTGGSPSARAAKSATSMIPIVFTMGDIDPVEAGFVASLSRPGGNMTGLTLLAGALGTKRLEILRELVPNAAVIAVLVNPGNPNAEPYAKEIEAAIRAAGREMVTLRAKADIDFEAAFSTIVEKKADALIVTADGAFTNGRQRLAALAAQHRVPTIYQWREFVLSGGLVSYGTSLVDAHRQIGVYVARILKGARPADLPVMQPTSFELVINLKTAKTLGLDVPPTLLARADEVIE
jgi:putative ABC transport system substrate-binding protein